MTPRHAPASGTLTRRAVLRGAGTAAFVLAFQPVLEGLAAEDPAQAQPRGSFAPDAFIRIDPDGAIRLVMPQVEMGQGIYTALAMVLAEELDADFAHVSVEHAPADEKRYRNPMLGIQATGNSNSVRAFWKPLRSAAAAARATLVQAAAARWKVSAAECSAARSQVTHGPTGRTASYGALALAASTLPLVKDAPLKDPARFSLIGTPARRVDTAGKVNGTAAFGIDTLLPGMKFATVAASPVLGGRVKRVDDSAARAVDGVHEVVVLEDLVAVVGEHMWAARKGLDALKVEWDDGANGSVSSAQMWEELRAASRKPGVTAREAGDLRKVPASAVRVDAAYELPLLAHATMEPMNCTVRVQGERCELWLGTQVIARVQQRVAALLRVPEEQVTVHNHLLGGGFGRRLEVDMALDAVRIAQRLPGVPVKVVWTREEDIRHDIYRPMYRDVVSASLVDGRVASFDYRVCGPSILARWLPPAFQKGIDIDAVDSAVDLPYDIPNLRIAYVRAEPKAVRTGFWRGVGCNNNVFAIESFMDELARKAGRDPIAFRKQMLAGTPRLRAALELAAAKSGWGTPLGPRVGRGVCAQTSFGSPMATVVEAEVDPQGEVAVRRVVAVVDTGIAINPDTIVAQLEGGIIFGLGAALHGDIAVKDGRVQQSNFHDYRVLRMNEVPKIEVHVVKSAEAPGGIGEAGTTAAPPALRNAIYAATGVALRALPIDRRALALGKA